MAKHNHQIASPSWINHARSCFAAHPTIVIPPTSYVHWSQDPNHKLLLRLAHLTVVAGALPPNSATLFHSHHHTSFVLSLLDTPDLLIQDMQPTDYVRRQPHRLLSLKSGACFTQCPVSAKLPLVHRATTLQHPVAFILLESSIPPLPTLAPSFSIDEHPSVKLQNHPSSNFWGAAQLHLDPNARASFQSRPSSSPLPVARFVCRTQSSLDHLEIEPPTHLTRHTRETLVAGVPVHVIAISGFKQSSDTCLQIYNASDADWCGVIVDIFGTQSSS